ncbi:hypothetical protein J4217_02130 [Candidatus Pacearchaeota archaeon]|nr:hypothetical protein [Candidatus Pacearchaeota archaeon]
MAVQVLEEMNRLSAGSRVASDMEIVLGLIPHIQNPCSDGKGHTLRRDYLNMAREMIPELENPIAIEILKDYIEKYS